MEGWRGSYFATILRIFLTNQKRRKMDKQKIYITIIGHKILKFQISFQVVKQLNMAVILKGRDGPVYEKSELKNFCLVAVIGSRERCLRDDFRPLNLQNPWKSGKLFVRMKNDLLAAFERTSIETSSQEVSSTTSTTTLLWRIKN